MENVLKKIHFYSFFIACLSISACSTLPSVKPYRISENTAVITLADEAYQLATLEQYDQAKSNIERALRMEPKNPALWLELARINKFQGDNDDALSLALRAKSLTQDNRLAENIDLFISELEPAGNSYTF